VESVGLLFRRRVSVQSKTNTLGTGSSSGRVEKSTRGSRKSPMMMKELKWWGASLKYGTDMGLEMSDEEIDFLGPAPGEWKALNSSADKLFVVTDDYSSDDT